MKNNISNQAEFSKLRKAAKLSAYVLPQLSGTFGTSLVKIMGLLGFTAEKLSETLQIGVRTILVCVAIQATDRRIKLLSLYALA